MFAVSAARGSPPGAWQSTPNRHGGRLTYLRGYTLGAPSHLLGRRPPEGRWPIGFSFLEDPVAALSQVAGALEERQDLRPPWLARRLALARY